MPLLVLSLLFLVVLLLPLVHPGGALQSTLLTTASIVIWAAFAVDYIARPYLSPARLTFVRTHVLDLVVLALPMLRPLRAVRLLRLCVMASVVGVLHQRGQRSLHARVGASVAGAVVVIVTVAAAAVYDVERHAPGSNIKLSTGAAGRGLRVVGGYATFSDGGPTLERGTDGTGTFFGPVSRRTFATARRALHNVRSQLVPRWRQGNLHAVRVVL